MKDSCDYIRLILYSLIRFKCDHNVKSVRVYNTRYKHDKLFEIMNNNHEVLI